MSRFTDAQRYEWIREHFTRLVVSVRQKDDGRRTVEGVRIGENLAKCDPGTVDQAIDDAMERYAAVQSPDQGNGNG